MRRFRVVYDLADPIGFGSLMFEATDLAAALMFLTRHYCRKPIELWCDGMFFGRLERVVEADAAYWRLLEQSAMPWVSGMLRGAGQVLCQSEGHVAGSGRSEPGVAADTVPEPPAKRRRAGGLSS